MYIYSSRVEYSTATLRQRRHFAESTRIKYADVRSRAMHTAGTVEASALACTPLMHFKGCARYRKRSCGGGGLYFIRAETPVSAVYAVAHV